MAEHRLPEFVTFTGADDWTNVDEMVCRAVCAAIWGDRLDGATK